MMLDSPSDIRLLAALLLRFLLALSGPSQKSQTQMHPCFRLPQTGCCPVPHFVSILLYPYHLLLYPNRLQSESCCSQRVHRLRPSSLPTTPHPSSQRLFPTMTKTSSWKRSSEHLSYRKYHHCWC